MKPVPGFIACLAFSTAAWGQQTVVEFHWNDLGRAAGPVHITGPILPGELRDYQKIRGQLIALQAKQQQLLATYTTNFPAVQINQARIAAMEMAGKKVEKMYPALGDFLRMKGIPMTVDGREALKLENTNDAVARLTLLTIDQPGISAQKYAVQGEFRYDAAPLRASVLEMVSEIEPGQEGVATDQSIGPMMTRWSPFSLAFDNTGGSGPPARLQLKIFLGGKSTVYLGPIRLVQYPAGQAWFHGGAAHPWWSSRTAAWVGGWGGCVIGCLGGLLGALCSMGKARGFVIALLRIQIVLGLGLGAAGVVALAQHQPYAVWYPLLLPAIILVTVSWANLPAVDRRYRELELRRMQALDA